MLAMKPDLVLAFSMDLSNDKGTRDAVNKATKKGIKVWWVRSRNNIGIIEPTVKKNLIKQQRIKV